MPGTRASCPVTSGARSSGFATRRIATKSHSPVTEYASVTPSTSARALPRSGRASQSARIRTTAWVTARRSGRRHGSRRGCSHACARRGAAASCALGLVELLAAPLALRLRSAGLALGAREGPLGRRALALGCCGGLLGLAQGGARGLHALLRGLLARRLGLALGGRALALGG